MNASDLQVKRQVAKLEETWLWNQQDLECWSISFWEENHFEAFNGNVVWSQDGTEIFYQSIKPKEKAWAI